MRTFGTWVIAISIIFGAITFSQIGSSKIKLDEWNEIGIDDLTFPSPQMSPEEHERLRSQLKDHHKTAKGRYIGWVISAHTSGAALIVGVLFFIGGNIERAVVVSREEDRR